MNIELLQKEIDKTEYWDMLILDIQIQYFGDEIIIYIENEDTACWEIKFSCCYTVSYETDAIWRGNFKVKDIGPHSGYYGQNISIKECEENAEFIDISMDFSIMTMKVLCKNIEVKECNIEEMNFFWKSDK